MTMTWNVRHGFGSREYCPLSGYKGEWDEFIREGKGLMIWSNHDFYRGEWKNGVMSGYGIYIWDAYYNNTMAMPSISAYRGYWNKGERHGYGNIILGFGLGSFYKGEFKNNKKHGIGKLVTNNGLMLQDKRLFIDDNLGPMTSDARENINPRDYKQPYSLEPYQFDICDSTVGLIFHIQEALRNIDREADIRNCILTDFIENNKGSDTSYLIPKIDLQKASPLILDDLMNFEEMSLRKSLRCYETDLKNIYYQYATICNTERINFTPVLIRLYLWQLYYDCNIHEKGLTLVQIDRLFHQNPQWLAKSPHDPFEKIYFWQFIHGLVSVASKLYAKRQLPDKKPDTIVASAFRMFMEKDVLPGAGRRRGRLTNGYGSFVPLKGLYKVYRSLGEPCTIRSFICAVRQSPHCADSEIPFVEEEEDPPEGYNVYVFGDTMIYITDEALPAHEFKVSSLLKLFTLGNLSSKTIIKVFSLIFPQIISCDKIMDLNIEITFFEFFEAFILCAEESIRMKDG